MSLLSAQLIPVPVGITRTQKTIEGLISPADLDYSTRKIRVLVVGGLDGSAAAAKTIRDELARFREVRSFAVSAIPLANPDGVTIAGFPPSGDAYATNTEAHYLWRFIGMHAPDLVVVAGPDFGLTDALGKTAPAGTGTVPARRIEAKTGFLSELGRQLLREKFKGSSQARREIQQRLARTPEQVARELAMTYGHELPEAVYIPAVALIGRLRLGAVADVERIVEPYASGKKSSLEKATGSHLSGHLIFAELYALTRKPRYLELVRAAADLGFDDKGKPRESMPMHSEMSDSVFMGCPILAQAGRLTGETKYFDMALQHLRFMQKLGLRADGLYRHSPLDEAAWGRGNGFPALGLALTLDALPREHPGFGEALKAFQAHLEALTRHQDRWGMWHQVIDTPGSYRELTATSMIGFAMLRGIRNGWLDRKVYGPRAELAWEAVKARAASDRRLVDVCTGTGKQRSLQEYLDRPAILGKDARGGAMALLFATEMIDSASGIVKKSQ